MKQKRNMIKHIAFTLAVLIAVFHFTSCGSKIPSPTETTDTFLKALKEQNMEAMSGVYSGENLDLLENWEETSEDSSDSSFDTLMSEQLVPKMLEFDYEIGNEQIDGEKATVDVTIKTYRIGDAFTSFISEYMTQALMLAFSDASEEELDALSATLLSGKLADLSEKTYEKTATLNLSMKDGKWVIDEVDPESDFFDALTGGLGSAIKTMEGMFSGFEEEE